LVLNPRYLHSNISDFSGRTYKTVLDISDTIFACNYFLGYFKNSENIIDLLTKQKISDLKEKSLWESYNCPFENNIEILDSDFGVNVYFVGQPKQGSGKRKVPDYLKLLDLTSSHINFGGFRCTDFVCTFTKKHNSIKFFKDKDLPVDEYILGFIRLDSGVLSNKPLQTFTGMKTFSPEVVNSHIVNSKIIVPTQPFGSFYRGGKLLSLLSQSNELRDFFNELYESNIVLWYTMSLYGSTKDSSQYDQLDRFIKFIGVTESRHPVRMKNPHKNNLINWLNQRGISKSNFVKGNSSQEDKTFKNLIHYLEYCLLINRQDKTVNKLRKLFEMEVNNLKNNVEKKRVYVSTYGLDQWDDNLVSSNREVNENHNLSCLFDYWKSKVFKRKDWGMRKYKERFNSSVPLKYQLLNDQLKDSSFNFVR